MVKYILHFLKQEHISSRPDSSLSDTLHRHSDMSKNECPKLSGLDRIFYPPFTLYTWCTGTQSQEVTDHSTAVCWPDSLGGVIFTDVAQGTDLCPLVQFESWTWPTETVSLYKRRVLRVCTVTRGRSCMALVLCPGWWSWMSTVINSER